jgi:hypothetical protein
MPAVMLIAAGTRAGGRIGNGYTPASVDGAMQRRTKHLAIGGIAVAALAIAAVIPMLDRHPVGNAAVPQPAKSVELPRYLGRWYEIARYEQRFAFQPSQAEPSCPALR